MTFPARSTESRHYGDGRGISHRARQDPGAHGGGVGFPVQLALAQAVHVPPVGPGWWAEPKSDGHRTAIWRTGGRRAPAVPGRPRRHLLVA